MFLQDSLIAACDPVAALEFYKTGYPFYLKKWCFLSPCRGALSSQTWALNSNLALGIRETALSDISSKFGKLPKYFIRFQHYGQFKGVHFLSHIFLKSDCNVSEPAGWLV
jgi:hypothetical protein